MNHLSKETSPYLLQHAHNPVHWYAWKEEAFARALREDKPILVSIGYSTCHWCHVMERESFENEQVAAFMNEHFINIKVDREERPDVDQIYMEACQAISGSGGWPLNCFLTPDKKPFFAGTYFPPRPAYQRASWFQVLQNIYQAFHTKRSEVEEQATRLLQAIERSGALMVNDDITGLVKTEEFNPEFLDKIFTQLEPSFDTRDGGFGGAPKFPGSMSLSYLLRDYYHTGRAAALEHVLFSLDKMILGGIYDQLGGGFARYATDRAWLVPHFEKMLYDNALLLGVLAEAWKISGKRLYRDTIEETMAYVEREMRSEEGGFYAALDADSEGVEGKFYVWTKAEVEAILGAEAATFCAFYDVSEDGNWEGNSILWRKVDFAAFAEQKGRAEEELRAELARGRDQLFEARAKRVRPGLDDKQLLSWNALMITAYTQCFTALGKESYRQSAKKAIDFLLNSFRKAGSPAFYHTFKKGEAQYPAFLSDYAFLIEALIAVYQITFEEKYLEEARAIADFVCSEFADTESALFFFTQQGQKDIPVRRKETYDSALPSGNATMAQNLQRLGILFDQSDYLSRSEQMLLSMKAAAVKYPTSFSRWAANMLSLVYPTPEVAVVGPEARKMAQAVQEKFIPGMLIMATEEKKEEFPLLRGKPIEKDTYIYVCQHYACQQPVRSIADFEQLIKKN